MQVEGGITGSDWAELERKGDTPPIGKACDHYNRFEEDLDIVKSLNLNTFRFSVEWARVEPEEGKFDGEELDHYRKVVAACHARNIKPFVCLWHFSLPLWFSQSGSFGRKDAVQIFSRYVKRVVGAFGDDVEFYITMNEPLVWIGEHGKTVHSAPSFWPNPFAGFLYLHKLIRAHKAAYKAIKEAHPSAQVGIAKHQFSFIGSNLFGSAVAFFARLFWNRYFLNRIKGYQDYVGIQFYQRWKFWWSKEELRDAQYSDLGWQLNPEAIYDPIKEAARYGLPIYITESGLADAKDQYRAAFIRESLEAVRRAIAEGIPVKGYLHWSLLDNYEFTHGYEPQFGLVHVDFESNQKRTVRESARFYATIAKDNTV